MTGTGGGNHGGHPGSNPGRTSVSGVEMAGAGLQFTAILVLSSFAGMWLDRKVGTSPWLLIFMVFLGAAAGFYSLYHKLMKGQRLGDRRKKTERRDEGE